MLERFRWTCILSTKREAMQFNQSIQIASKTIDTHSSVFIIAEAGVNHNGSLELAYQLIDLAISAGADAVKFQQFDSEQLVLDSTEQANYQKRNLANNQSQLEMLKQLELSIDEAKLLQDYCLKSGIVFLTTPFDERSLKQLDGLNMPAYKVSSTDLTNIPFLIEIAQKNKPIILSTGMSYLSEIESALEAILPYNQDVILLQCHSDYPTQDSDVNLNVLRMFQERFNILVGFSDHTPEIGASPYAIPMGAKVLEKHFTLDKTLVGPDHSASLSPEELSEYVAMVRRVELYMGSSIKQPSIVEQETRKSLQKCLVARTAISKGEMFSRENLVAKRTGGEGISPIYFDSIVGGYAPKEFQKDEIIGL